jgi:dolichol-phosphate mannosyltransferase
MRQSTEIGVSTGRISRRLRTLAVVIPMYNEEAMVDVLYHKVYEELTKLNISFYFIFVDDGSKDTTLAKLNLLADKLPEVNVLSLARNWGHQIALTAGIDYADAEAVVVMDADLQHPPGVIAEMIRKYETGAEIVYGVRDNPQQAGLLKRLASSGYYTLLDQTTNIHIVRNAADFRLMSGAAIGILRQMHELHRHLRGMVAWTGLPSDLVYYSPPDRYAGQLSYTWLKSLRLGIHGVFSFSTLPLNIITWVGLGFSVLTLLYLIVVLVSVVLNAVIPGWASIIGVLLIVGSFQFVALGVLAQYLGMLYEEQKQRPLYVLKQLRLNRPSLGTNEASATPNFASALPTEQKSYGPFDGKG